MPKPSIAVSPSPKPSVGSFWKMLLTVVEIALPSAFFSPAIAIDTSLWFGGQSTAMSGAADVQSGALCLTVTANVALAESANRLVAVHVTGVVPIANVEPGARVHTT